MFENNPTPEAIKQAILDRLDPSISRMDGSYTDTLAASAALEIWKMNRALAAVPSCVSLTPESPRAVILSCCKDMGITPKPGSRAVAQLTVRGQDGAVVAKGKRFLTVAGLVYSATAAATIENGTAVVPVEAAEVGAQYNQPAGRIVIQMETQAGINEVFGGAATGGADEESIESMLERYHLYLQKPATSANAYQYKQWALSVDGVGDALILPLVEGAGTVGVVLASPNMQPVDDTVVARCKAYIDSQRPADAADLLVSSAKGVTINLSATVRIAASTTIETVTQQQRERLTAYCKESVAFANEQPPYASELPYAKVGYILLGIDGVADYSNLLVNGDTANISIAADELPMVGEVVLTC